MVEYNDLLIISYARIVFVNNKVYSGILLEHFYKWEVKY